MHQKYFKKHMFYVRGVTHFKIVDKVTKVPSDTGWEGVIGG